MCQKINECDISVCVLYVACIVSEHFLHHFLQVLHHVCFMYKVDVRSYKSQNLLQVIQPILPSLRQYLQDLDSAFKIALECLVVDIYDFFKPRKAI